MSEKMTTSEPTTGEIVEEARRVMLDAWGCAGCDLRTVLRQSIGRLESQEAQIKQLTEALAYANEWHKESVENATNELRELSGIAGELERMTARAEQAEQKNKELINKIVKLEGGTWT